MRPIGAKAYFCCFSSKQVKFHLNHVQLSMFKEILQKAKLWLSRRKKNVNWMKVFTFVMIALIVFAPLIFTRGLLCSSVAFNNTGQIGDTIGGTTAPFIGVLSAILLYVTLNEQRKFNRQQQRLAMEEQFKTMFFNLLNVQRDITSKLELSFFQLNYNTLEHEVVEKKSLDCFSKLKSELEYIFYILDKETFSEGYDIETAKQQISSLDSLYPGLGIDMKIYEREIRKIKDNYRINFTNFQYVIVDNVYAEYHNEKNTATQKLGIAYRILFSRHESIGYYFRHLYHLLKFIKTEETKFLRLYVRTTEQEKDIKWIFKEYSSIVQAQMSIPEQVMLFYDSCLYPKMKDLVQYYGMLDSLSPHNLILESHNCVAGINLKVG